MKEVYKAVSDVLLGDTDLLGMVNYTDVKINIRRGFVPAGKWDILVCYYMQSEIRLADFSSNFRILPMIVRVLHRESDLLCDEIAERVFLLLDGADLDVDGNVHLYNSKYEGEVIPTSWNNDLKSYERALRFKLLVRMDEVVGNSGLPTRKRKTVN